LGEDTVLKTLSVDVGSSMDESLSTAIKDGLGMNETLENLKVEDVRLCNERRFVVLVTRS
jgi:hypothetical protein